MKLVKLLRPLFLVALGLHGLALFLPLGGASEMASEIAEEEAAKETIAPGEETLLTPEKLPVPDLNVAANGTANKATSVPASTSVLAPVAIRQPTSVVQPRRAAMSAPLAMAVPPASAPRTTPRNTPKVGSLPSGVMATPLYESRLDEARLDESGLDESGLGKTGLDEAETGPVADAASSSPPLELSVLPEEESADEPDSSLQPRKGARSLIASALIQLPDSLKALMQRWAIALDYNPKGTDDSSAKTARDKWTDKINSQASRNSMGRLEPGSIEDFARLSYPIEASVRDRKQSFRVCLEQSPGPVEVGVLFDSQGKIVGEPELIRSSGYSAVNEEAIATVETLFETTVETTVETTPELAERLPNNRLSKAFVLEIPVDYDSRACVKLADVKN